MKPGELVYVAADPLTWGLGRVERPHVTHPNRLTVSFENYPDQEFDCEELQLESDMDTLPVEAVPVRTNRKPPLHRKS